MVVGRRRWKFLLLPLLVILLLTACERPLASNENDNSEANAAATAEAETVEHEEPVTSEDEAEADTSAAGDEVAQEESADDETQQESASEEAESSDPDVGGGTPETAADEAEASAESDASVETEGAEEAVEDEQSESDQVTDEGADAEAAPDATTDEEATAEESTDEEAAAEDETQSAAEAETASTLPATHTVAPGENLYRIGLKYGMSWVTLAAYNNLPNPNYIRVGQVLYIPGGGEPVPTPPPAPPDAPAYVDYVVQPGDTLYSIGRKFGVSWVEIAEANGIVNPNLIYAGQVLKIPTSQPETPPAVTHTVKPGETLYRISLQYGVHWLAIAQANHIVPPYVIYPGQVLVIPGG